MNYADQRRYRGLLSSQGEDVGSITATAPSMRQDMLRGLMDLFSGDGSDPAGARRRAQSIAGLMDFVPVYGEASDLTDSSNAFSEGRVLDGVLSAAAGAIGVVPVVGDVAARAIRGSGKKIYHGTSGLFDEFDINKSADGTVWFTDNKASIESGDVGAASKGNIMERLIDEDALKLGGWIEQDRYSVDELIQQGYDGLKLSEDGISTYQIYNPNKLSQVAESIGGEVLPNSPMPANIPNRGLLNIGPNPDAEAAAVDYAQRSGIPYRPIQQLNPVDAQFGEQAAREYGLMRHDPSNRFVKESYGQMKQEVAGQFEAMLRQGVKPEFDLNPYPDSPYESLLDLIENKRLKVFPTSAGYGPAGIPKDISQNPMLEMSKYTISGQPATYNDLFRAVHDFQGHSKTGAGFRASGEDNAYLSHAGTMGSVARKALATETRGQNSFLNFGPDGAGNRGANIDDTVFADQKIGLLPNYITEKGTPELYARQQRFDQLRSGDNTGLEGAIDDAGNLRLVHYSPRPIERIDPNEYGKGLSGRTIQERNRAASPDFVKRNFYGIEADQNPYKKEYGLGQNKVETQIDAAQVYDAQKDPEGLWKKGKGDPTLSEKAIFDAGFSGYFVNNKQLGKVAAIFDPLDVTKKLMVPLATVGAGLLGASAMEDSEVSTGLL